VRFCHARFISSRSRFIFVLFYLTWVACISALMHNTLWIYGLIGVMGGFAYLTKGSISPMLAVFVGVSSLRCVWELLSAKRRGFVLSRHEPLALAESSRRARRARRGAFDDGRTAAKLCAGAIR